MSETAHVVVVDDEYELLSLSVRLLKEEGFSRVVGVNSVPELLHHLVAGFKAGEPVDVILMDIDMPGVDGIEGTRQVREIPICRSIPILMLSSIEQPEILKAAFEAGAMDYIVKNRHPIELATRVRSALTLKRERDSLQAREQELIELTRQLQSEREPVKETSYLDPLTGVYNAKAFERITRTAWEQAYSSKAILGLLLIGLDDFSEYNLHYGREAGDVLLRQVAALLPANDRKTFSMRFEGSIFAVLLTEDAEHKAGELSESLITRMRQLRLPHDTSQVDPYATLSIGYTVQSPAALPQFSDFLQLARAALVEAGKQGHNRAVRLTSLREAGHFRPL